MRSRLAFDGRRLPSSHACSVRSVTVRPTSLAAARLWFSLRQVVQTGHQVALHGDRVTMPPARSSSCRVTASLPLMHRAPNFPKSMVLSGKLLPSELTDTASVFLTYPAVFLVDCAVVLLSLPVA